MRKSQDVVFKTRSIPGEKYKIIYKGDREQWMQK